MIKNNNKGFTVVELMISFSLTAVILILLFQIVLSLKDVYVSSGIKTEMLVKNANFLKYVQTDLHNNTLTALNSCGTQCYQFEYADGSNVQLSTNVLEGTISYGNYKTKMINGAVMDTMNAFVYTDSTVEEGINDTIVSIVIPMKNKLFPTEKHDISIVFQVDSRSGFTTDIAL